MDAAINCIVWVVVGGIAGTLAGRLVRGKGYGPIGDIVLGLIGSVVGNIAFSLLGLGPVNIFGSIAVAMIGGVIFVILIRVFLDSQFAS